MTAQSFQSFHKWLEQNERGGPSGENFEAWLAKQSKSTAICISARAGLRVWPLVTRSMLARRLGKEVQAELVLSAARSLLTSSVAALRSNSEISTAAMNASKKSATARVRTAAASKNDSEVHRADTAAQLAMIAARAAADTGSEKHAAARVSGAAAYSDASMPPAVMAKARLWEEPPAEGSMLHPDVVAKNLSALGPEFNFWEQWYRAASLRKPLDFELQRRVALIEDAVWIGEDAPHRVAERIEEIEAEYLAEKTPLAEDVEINSDTGKVRVVPRPLENASLIGTILARTEDALGDALQGQNGLREDMRQVRELRRTHARYGNDPQRIELDYTSVAVSLRRDIRETNELADTEDNLALLEAVEEGALAVRAHHPEVAENRNRIAYQRVREADPQELALLEVAGPILIEMCDSDAADDFAQDIPQFINDATTLLPSGAPALPGADEAMRIFNRSAKIKLLWEAGEFRDDIAEQCEKLAAKGADCFDSNGFKSVRLVTTVSGILSALVAFGLSLFGVL